MASKTYASGEVEIFKKFLKSKKLRFTKEREDLLTLMFSFHRHLSVDEVVIEARKKNLRISRATIYRNLTLMVQAGLLREMRIRGRASVYEHTHGHDHHDHLICNKCGDMVEFLDPTIEKRQEAIAKKHGYKLKTHTMVLAGLCPKCK